MREKRRILIVEDDADMIELLSLILRRGGYEPVPALGGLEGLRLLKDDNIDLILLDLMMDDMNGWTVLQAVRGNEQSNKIPVVIVSARHQIEDPSMTSEHAGQFDGYLVKPFVIRDLLSLIEETIV